MKNQLLDHPKGQALTEYLVLVVLLSVACIAATQSLGRTLRAKIDQVRKQVQTEVTLESVRESRD